ncbi:velvet factor-domain-containing protein [Mycena rebaudengoi]|nr:velvet factor-domain-containing protein [Mycena rebaudengoi]
MYTQPYSALHQYALSVPHSGTASMMAPASQQTGGALHQYPSRSHHQPTGTSLIGKPIHFTGGQFAGQTIRAEMQELQAAAFGRKYAKVDRRPLDPPPVAWLRLFFVYNAGTERESEVEVSYDDLQILGLMCTVDLLPVPIPSTTPTSSPPATQLAFTPSPRSPTLANGYGNYGPSPPISPLRPTPPLAGYAGVPPPDTLILFDNYPVTESSKATTSLAGTTFVQADSIPWRGKTSLLFTFADLAVKTEGYFILRYRFFDLFSKPTGHSDLAIQAECYGNSFRIYSSKEVPPLGKSTELTKHLARYGVRVNVRETERKRKKKEKVLNDSPPYTTTKVPDRHASEGSDDDDDD